MDESVVTMDVNAESSVLISEKPNVLLDMFCLK